MSYSGQTTRHSPCLCLTKTKREKEDQHGQRGDEERSTSTLRASFLAQSKSELPQKAAIIVRPPARSTGATAASPGSGQETKGCRPATTPPNPHTPTRQRREFWLLSKVHPQSLNLCCCIISVSKLTNRPFRSSNLFICVISVHKLVPLCHPGP